MGKNVASSEKRVLRESSYRPESEPTERVLCSVRSVGHYRLGKETPMELPRRKDFWELFWTVNGRGTMTLGTGEVLELEPGRFGFYYPGEEHRVKRVGDLWEYWWVTFDNPDFGEVLERLELPRQGGGPGTPCPEGVFTQLLRQLGEPTPQSSRRCSVLGYSILVEAGTTGAVRRLPPLAEQARTFLDEHYVDPMLNVEHLADHLGVHRSTLFRGFREAYGLSPSKYLQSRRTQRALTLLRETPFPISTVTFLSGFIEPNYFAKCIKRLTGLSPREFRESS
jgi:AraC-like DNA-binding protein/mannose-6-phosphate isomerase-like protein (cupin superfamily)